MKFFRRLGKGGRLLTALGALNLILIVAYANSYIREKRSQDLERTQSAKEKTVEFANQVEQKLPPLMEIADRIADDLMHGRLDSTSLIKRLGEDVGKLDYIDGLFVAYKPYKFSKNDEFFAPLFLQSKDGHRLDFIEYDYTVNDWFQKPIVEGATWVEPFFGKMSGDVLIQYGVPIYDSQQEPIGIVAINVSPEELKKIVSASLSSGESGYGFILSRKGIFIHHPISALIQNQTNVLALAQELNDIKMQKAAEKVLQGKAVMVKTKDPFSFQKTLIVYEPVSLSGWTVGIHFYDERAANDYRRDSADLFWLLLGSFSFLIILVFALIQLLHGSVNSYWLVTIITSLLFIMGIYFIWYRTMNIPPVEERQRNDLMIANEAVLEHFIEHQNSIARKIQKEVTFIPTGVFVQHIQFVNAYNVMVSGYLWQTYSKEDSVYSDGEPISRGFIFAETEPNAEVLSIEEAYRKDLGDRELIGWYFRVSVREEFFYHHYPFDRQRLWLRLWHQDFNRRVILVPDLSSYRILNPSALPGLEMNFVLPNWSLRASYFDYKFNSYNTTFGIESEFGTETKPELYFNVVIQREFLSPFITNIVPMIVVAVIVFTVLMSSMKTSSGDQFLGFSGFGVVELCAAFFFIVIISQIEIRGSLEVSNIIYLDYFYFLIYLMLLAVSVNSILFTRTDSIRFIEYRDNLIPKMIYWPVLLGTLLVITYAVFF